MNWSSSSEELDKLEIGSYILLRNKETKIPFTIALKHKKHFDFQMFSDLDADKLEWLFLTNSCFERVSKDKLEQLPRGTSIVTRTVFDDNDEEYIVFNVYEKLVILGKQIRVEFEPKNGYYKNNVSLENMIKRQKAIFIVPE